MYSIADLIRSYSQLDDPGSSQVHTKPCFALNVVSVYIPLNSHCSARFDSLVIDRAVFIFFLITVDFLIHEIRVLGNLHRRTLAQVSREYEK